MTSRTATIPPPGGTCCRILELRRYVLHPGQREVMIELFDRCFVESQEELGIRVVGQFRVRGQPDVFAWIRGFPDMTARARSLEAFYGESDAWRRNRDAANATMIEFDNVLLLKPAGRGNGFSLNPADRPGPDAPEAEGGMIGAEIYPSDRPVSEEVVTEYESEVIPTRRRSGIVPLALLVTEPSVNTFPRLPVREGEHVFVSFSACPGGAARMTAPRFAAAGLGEPQMLELEPTRRSLLRAK
jgi:NIPSNAP